MESADTAVAALRPPLLPEAAAAPPFEAFTEFVGGGGDGSTAEAPRELHGRLSIASEVYLWPVASRKHSTCSMLSACTSRSQLAPAASWVSTT